ncbi:MAG: HEAT repeat domain-containing protein [Terracidiphilus sp.]
MIRTKIHTMIRTMIRLFAFAVATTLVTTAGFSEVLPGDQSHWSLDFRARIEQSSASPIELHLVGEWTATVVAVRAGEYDEQLQLEHLQFTGDAVKNAPASSLAEMQGRLSRPFWATHRRDGGLVEMHFLRDQSPSNRNLLQMIATELQLVRPDSARNSWTAQERDGAGEYSALYVMPQSDHILKRKLKYMYTDGVAGTHSSAMDVAIDQSEVTFSLTSNGQVKQVDGVNRVRMSFSSNQSEKLSAATEFHLSNLRSAHAPDLIGSLQAEQANVVDSPVVTQRTDTDIARNEADERLLKGDSTEAILTAAFARNSDAAPIDPIRPMDPIDRLTALFRQRPEAASAAVAMLKKEGSQRSVINALGASSSTSAVAALSALAHDTAATESLRVDAILAFVQMQHPSAEAMRAPGNLLNDANPKIRSAARMMSGALSHAGRAEHPTEAASIDDSLVALYRSAHETHERIEFISALGNSAGPSIIPVLEEALHDSAAPIRGAAARGLRLAAGSDIDRALAAVITSDPDGSVRADAIFATRFRHPLPASLADALLESASTDAATYVRSDSIAVLGQNPTASPRVTETLERIAKQDADASIRRQAQQTLEHLSAIASNHHE